MRIQALPNPRPGGPGTPSSVRRNKYRSYLQVWYLIYHKVEVSHLSQPYHPATAFLLSDIRISIVHRHSQSRTKYFHVDTFPLSATRHHIYVHSAPGLPASGHLLSNPASTFHLNIAIYALPPFVIMRSRSSSATSSTSGKSLPTDNIQIFVAISGGKSEQKPFLDQRRRIKQKLTGSPKR
jgi:hypothetical protein